MFFASKKAYAPDDDDDSAVERVDEAELMQDWATSNPVLDEDDAADGFAPAATGAAAPPAPLAAGAVPGGAPRGFMASMTSWGGFGSRKPAARSAAPPTSTAHTKKKLRFMAKPVSAPTAAATGASTTQQHQRQVDTNVVAVRLGTLANGVPFHSGDAVECAGCHAVLSAISVLEPKCWPCEFCGHRNAIDLAPEEMPKEESIDYVLAPAPAVARSEEESRIIFCVDISGSMCVTTEVPGRVSFRGDRTAKLNAELNAERASQVLPRGRRDVTYVSRLQAMQGAVDGQLRTMQERFPNRRIGLVTFNSEVQIVGDGTGAPLTVSGDRLASRDELLRIGAESPLVTRPISATYDALSRQVFALEEGGQTALGPALAVAIALAGAARGSQVIVCTDGLANVGLGSLDGGGVEADQFYTDMGVLAQQRGVVVSVISIEGTECRLASLGTVADATGGTVERVKPLELAENFQSLLEKPVIATHVGVTMHLHRAMYFRGEDTAACTLTRDVGNVTEDSELLLEFALRPRKRPAEAAAAGGAASDAAGEAAPMDTTADAAAPAPAPAAMDTAPETTAKAAAAPFPPASAAPGIPPYEGDLTGVAQLPFQVQIRFTRPDGMQCLRVLSKAQPISKDRKECEAEVDVAMCAARAAQHSAQLVQKGDYEGARVNAHAWRNVLGRQAASDHSSPMQQAQFANYCAAMGEMDGMVQQAQRAEAMEGLRYAAAPMPEERERGRHARRSDMSSRMMFHAKKTNTDMFM